MSDSESNDDQTAPRGELTIRVLAMPADANQNGDIFGGWVLGQMDIAGDVFVSMISQSRAVTIAVDAMAFRKPVFIGDVVSIYVDLIRVGRTSVAVSIEAWVARRGQTAEMLVTEGKFTYVAIDDEGRPRPVRPTEPNT